MGPYRCAHLGDWELHDEYLYQYNTRLRFSVPLPFFCVRKNKQRFMGTCAEPDSDVGEEDVCADAVESDHGSVSLPGRVSLRVGVVPGDWDDLDVGTAPTKRMRLSSKTAGSVWVQGPPGVDVAPVQTPQKRRRLREKTPAYPTWLGAIQ